MSMPCNMTDRKIAVAAHNKALRTGGKGKRQGGTHGLQFCLIAAPHPLPSLGIFQSGAIGRLQDDAQTELARIGQRSTVEPRAPTDLLFTAQRCGTPAKIFWLRSLRHASCSTETVRSAYCHHPLHDNTFMRPVA